LIHSPRTTDLLRHLAGRPGHDEVKADFRQLLTEEFGVELHHLDFERRVPEIKGRLDALIGRTVFEAKKNLDQEWADVLRRMPDYLADREREEREKFVGIASDGLKWVVFERSGDELVKVKETILDPDKADAFLAWLDGAVALKSALPPDPLTVRIELGGDSVAFRRANEKLAALWDKLKADSAVVLKRQLWAQLLKLVYGREVESDQLFFQHTFLVVVAKAIALAVLDMNEDDPARILSGRRFEAAGILGAVESDFFDWIIADAEGIDLVRRIVIHVRRFKLRDVATDILKILYESLIDRDERHGLGEYYTPDWLAAKIVRNAVSSPHEQRVLDPACGSGTFLFHAIRHYLAEAEDVGVPMDSKAAEATALVAGLDIHPVAVIIARVTYLLALAPVLQARKGAISIPVYLGDALQLSMRDTLGMKELTTYVARDLSRPLAFSFNNGWANVVIGNPPWVSFRHMSADLQKRFREMSKAERIYVGGKFATQSDLSALFTVRVVALYLRSGGRIAFVLPLAALTRGQFEKLRAGSFSSARIAWDEVWTMDDSVQPLFPVPSCAMFGRRRATARRVPEVVRAYSGLLPCRDAHEDLADKRLKVTENAPKPAEGRFTGGSAYRDAFRQGATLVPRMLCLVERRSMGRLGSNPAAPLVVSRRNSQEKKPWKDLPGVEHSVEAQFLHPVLLGESILPYRVSRSFEGVVPASAEGAILDADAAANRGYAGLHGWMSEAERIWNENQPSDMSLVEQFNYYGKLKSQFPIPPLRVVYAASGTIPAACLLRANSAVIEHKLYWSAPSTESEALFLAGILNSEAARERFASLQSRGQWGARDFDKVVFTLPIPRFDETVSLHAELAAAACDAENLVASIALPDGVRFQRARKLVRDGLTEARISTRIDGLVARLLDG
jgi:SAM-dependent methyltransferase